MVKLEAALGAFGSLAKATPFAVPAKDGAREGEDIDSKAEVKEEDCKGEGCNGAEGESSDEGESEEEERDWEYEELWSKTKASPAGDGSYDSRGVYEE